MGPELLLILHAAITWSFCGILWFVQLIHYPMARNARIKGFEREHTRRVMRPAVIILVVELLTGLGLLVWRPPAVPLWMPMVGALLLIGVWSVTWVWCVPCHRQMCATGQDAVGRLLRANGVRVLFSSIRALLCVAMLLFSL